MAANPQCPLDPFILLQLENQMNLALIKEIESHISSSFCFHPPLKDIVLHGNLDGSTPLLLACEQGDLKSVQHIVDVWGSDVRAAANFYYYGVKIEEASPIFVAALKRHVDIVRYLISKDANLSATTSAEGNSSYSSITPLQVALGHHRTDGSMDDWWVKNNVVVDLLLKAGANPSTLSPGGLPMWCFGGVHSVIALINHGIDLNLRCLCGDTILHDWISWASYDLDIIDKEQFFVDGVQSLIARGVDLMARGKKGFTPIISLANLLKVGSLSTQLGILEVLLEREDIDADEKIDAMELAGAKLLLALEPEKAFHYWRRALLLRDNLSHYPKIPLQMTSTGRAEWITSEQLENVFRDKSVHWIQAKVTMLRIYADRSIEDVLYRIHYIEEYSGQSENAPTETQMSDLLLETLGVILRLDPNEHHRLWKYKKDIIQKLIIKLPPTLGNDMPLPNVECERIKTSVQLVRKLILAADPDEGLTLHERVLRTGRPGLILQYPFFVLLAGMPDVILHEDVWKYLSESSRQNEWFKTTRLAQACEKKDWKTLNLLLHLQADPNEETNWRTGGGNGPLHLVADQQDSSDAEHSLGNLLFAYGAQPYRRNKQGKTAVDIWIEKNCGVEGTQSSKWKNRPCWCRNIVPKSLQLLFSRGNDSLANVTSRLDRLPDDMLLYLSRYHLGERDRLALAFSGAKRFPLLYGTKRKRLVLSQSYFITSSSWKSFFELNINPSLITTFDASSCYWLPAQILCQSLKQMVNVEEVYIQDTNISLAHLPGVFLRFTLRPVHT